MVKIVENSLKFAKFLKKIPKYFKNCKNFCKIVKNLLKILKIYLLNFNLKLQQRIEIYKIFLKVSEFLLETI